MTPRRPDPRRELRALIAQLPGARHRAERALRADPMDQRQVGETLRRYMEADEDIGRTVRRIRQLYEMLGRGH